MCTMLLPFQSDVVADGITFITAGFPVIRYVSDDVADDNGQNKSDVVAMARDQAKTRC